MKPCLKFLQLLSFVCGWFTPTDTVSEFLKLLLLRKRPYLLLNRPRLLLKHLVLRTLLLSELLIRVLLRTPKPQLAKPLSKLTELRLPQRLKARLPHARRKPKTLRR